MSNPVSSWDDDYARLARAASQLRATGSTLSEPIRNNQVQSIQTGLNRLYANLQMLERNRQLAPAEVGRRRQLVEHLRTQLGGGNGGDVVGGGGGYGEAQQPQQISATTQALRQQDDMIDELAVGVGRLKDQTKLIHQEAGMHVKLLDEMGNDVEEAHAGLEAETARALKLKEDKSVW
eukprot:CAMPEP_0185723878 /NCGR_PEP_ID=MMETSP1171-20130828/569_1 /TAXON_ID=374046 /ORGANISM="Helicotheca tamensis, Strain CCMP826" /LENGTH=177 /DNA_ID=CAMNT_0028391645 /DNA_START=117 /DNA_END=647 /DNA_ORIENTATION=+